RKGERRRGKRTQPTQQRRTRPNVIGEPPRGSGGKQETGSIRRKEGACYCWRGAQFLRAAGQERHDQGIEQRVEAKRAQQYVLDDGPRSGWWLGDPLTRCWLRRGHRFIRCRRLDGAIGRQLIGYLVGDFVGDLVRGRVLCCHAVTRLHLGNEAILTPSRVR